MSVELAKAYLTRMLTDPIMARKLRVSDLILTGKTAYGLTRAELKAARKELGVVSEKLDGEQFWYLRRKYERESN